MTVRVGLNEFGCMGRLGLHAAWGFDPARVTRLSHPAVDCAIQ